jgi:hypothetical protein
VHICWAWFANDVAPQLRDQGNPAARLQGARIQIYTSRSQPIYNTGLTAYLAADNAATD